MKKSLLIITLLLTSFSLSACGSADSDIDKLAGFTCELFEATKDGDFADMMKKAAEMEEKSAQMAELSATVEEKYKGKEEEMQKIFKEAIMQKCPEAAESLDNM